MAHEYPIHGGSLRGVEWRERAVLSERERADVEALAAQCNQHDGTDLKLAYGEREAAADAAPTCFLAYRDEQLVGYCAIDCGGVDEICGMVAPAARRHGLGRRLLSRAHEASRDRRGQALLITEEAAPVGGALARAFCVGLAMTEQRLGLLAPGDLIAPTAPANGPVRLRPATEGDIDALATILAEAFNERPVEHTRANLHAELAESRILVGEVAGRPVGTLKIYPERNLANRGQRAGIYGFAVRPEYQGRGYGRQMLTQTLRLLLAEGYLPITLEVLPENSRAVALYTSVGMRPITTYHYYVLPVV